MNLSNEAQVLLAGTFGLGVDTVLTMHNIESRLSDTAREAMTELIGAGLVEAKKANNINAVSMSYRLTAKGKKLRLKKSTAFMEKHGRFSLTTKNTPDSH